MINNGDELPVLLDGGDEALIVPRQLIRRAAADADVAEATALRLFAGFPSRGTTRARLVAALRHLGAPGTADLLANGQRDRAVVATMKPDHGTITTGKPEHDDDGTDGAA
jgi:hypothetical protein